MLSCHAGNAPAISESTTVQPLRFIFVIDNHNALSWLSLDQYCARTMDLRLRNPFLNASYGPKPPRFIRITDDKSFIKPEIPGPTGDANPDVGFEVGYSTQYIDFCHRLTPFSVFRHLTWSPLCEWKGLISMCGTDAKAEREVAWRQKKDSRNICASFICTNELHWQTLQWNDKTTIDVLLDIGSEPVYFFKATELIEKFGLRNLGLGDKIIGCAHDEWLALEWIPKRIIYQTKMLS